MKSIFYNIILISTLSFFSCEKEIDLKVPQATPQIVVEGVITNNQSNNYVRLTKSKSIYENEELGFEPITDAEVTINDNLGNEFEFTYSENGFYIHNGFVATIGLTYQLNINAEGEHITGEDKLLPVVSIDEITFEDAAFGEENERIVYCHFQDPADVENFYLFRIGNYKTVTTDRVFDGNNTRVFMDRFGAVAGDEITINLLHINHEHYRYFYTLGSIEYLDQGGPFSGGTPGNPENTIEGNAIGFFGAFATDSMTVVVP